MQGASPLASPGLNGARHWFFLWKAGSFGYHSGARDSKPCRLGCGTGKQCRQPRRGGTGGEELRRLRWSSPPGLGEPVPPGGLPSLSPAYIATVVPGGGLAFFVACLPFYFSLLSCPHPPNPLPLRGRGRLKVILCKGLRPLHPRGCTHGSPRKRQEAVPYEQCRQPRREGTGGDGTIRRKRRRRLRWSSPPGLGEPVPPGCLPSLSPADLATVVPGGELAFFVARLPFYFSLLSCPHPPSPLPLRGRGRPKVYFAGGSAPGTPAPSRLRHLQRLPYKCPTSGNLRFAARAKANGCP